MTSDEIDNPTNILLLIWDACRYDYALEHASFLNELASSNIQFKKAIAPSPWSLPSHASIFTGQHPHHHKINRLGDAIDTPLVRELSDRSYHCYGVSANGFASQRTGFHEDFHQFRYTGGRDLYIDGMDVSGTSHRVLRDEDASQRDALIHILKEIPRHDYPIHSLANLIAVGCGRLATNFEQLQKIPHRLFAPTSDYSYRPEKNTRTIQSILQNRSRGKPFFLFTNYMDTHRCYKPNEHLQQKHLGRTLDYNELVRLNEEVAAPWAFESKKELNKLDQSDIDDVRGLYIGEVETADKHLKKLYETLEQKNILDNTLVIVTADHGENLGESDEMDRQRMGHEASVSDAVLRVPLVIAHPDLEAETVDQAVSLESLYDLCLTVADSSELSNSTILDALPTIAVSQYPATGGHEETIEKYPDVPETVIAHRSSEDSTVAYRDDWKVVTESTGKRWAFSDSEAIDFSDASESLTSLTKNHLNELTKQSTDYLSETQTSQLEALGYL